MLAEERREKILEEIQEVKVLKVLDLAKKYGVGIETIRRDFDFLEKKGKLKKIYGGATLVEEKKDFSYELRNSSEIEEKKEIAKKAVKFIEEEDKIFLNDSSTNLYLAKELKKYIKKLTLITNSLVIASELSDMPEYTIILAGGFLNNQEKAFFGPMSEEIISKFVVNKAILSVSSISLVDGITDFPLEEVNIQKKMIEYSKELIVLANSKKFETSSLIKVNDLENINTIITDSKISDNLKLKYKKIGIELV